MENNVDLIVAKRIHHIDDSFVLNENEVLAICNQGNFAFCTKNEGLLDKLKAASIFGDISSVEVFVVKRSFTVEGITMTPLSLALNNGAINGNFIAKYSVDYKFSKIAALTSFILENAFYEEELTAEKLVKHLDADSIFNGMLRATNNLEKLDVSNLNQFNEEYNEIFKNRYVEFFGSEGVANASVLELIPDPETKENIDKYLASLNKTDEAMPEQEPEEVVEEQPEQEEVEAVETETIEEEVETDEGVVAEEAEFEEINEEKNDAEEEQPAENPEPEVEPTPTKEEPIKMEIPVAPVGSPKYRCARCLAPLIPGAEFCPMCGTKTSFAKFCPNCGSKIGPDAKFCNICGIKLK